MLTLKSRDEMPEVLQLKDKFCVEVGVFKGEYARKILKAQPRHLWLVDPWKHQDQSVYPDDPSNVDDASFQRIFDELRKELTSSNVTLERASSVEIAEGWRMPLDFVYIDANHTYSQVLADMVSWWPRIKSGGWMCGHDYTGKYDGVRRAVQVFCDLARCELGLLTQEDWASWGIRKEC